MAKSRLSKSIRKHIASEKNRLRREGFAPEEISEKIKEWIELRMKKTEKAEKAESKKLVTSNKSTKKPAKSAPAKTKNQAKAAKGDSPGASKDALREKVASDKIKKSEPKVAAKESAKKGEDKK